MNFSKLTQFGLTPRCRPWELSRCFGCLQPRELRRGGKPKWKGRWSCMRGWRTCSPGSILADPNFKRVKSWCILSPLRRFVEMRDFMMGQVRNWKSYPFEGGVPKDWFAYAGAAYEMWNQMHEVKVLCELLGCSSLMSKSSLYVIIF